MRGLWTIARKDIRQRLSDRSAYVVGVVVPLALALLLGVAASQGEDVPTFAFVDEDRGSVATAFGDLLAALEADGVAEISVADRAQADQLVESNEAAAAFVVPAGYSAAVMAGDSAEVTVVGNPDEEIATQVAAGVATGFARNVNAVQLAVGTVLAVEGSEPDPAAMTTLIERAATSVEPTGLVRADSGAAGVEFTAHISFGMAVFFLFFAIQFGILGLIDERTRGTMARLLAAPIRPASILGGKTLASFVIGVTSVAVLVLATSLPPLETDWGNPAGVALLTVAGVLAAIGLVALIGGFARTSSDALGYMTFVAVLLGILGGTFAPVASAGGWLDQVSRLTPHRWLMDGYRALSVGQPVLDILPAVAVLVAFAVVTGTAGLLLFRNQLRSP